MAEDRDAEASSDDDNSDDDMEQLSALGVAQPICPAVSARSSRYRPMKLSKLFGSQERPVARWTQRNIDVEAALMEAEAEEDARLDDGAMVGSGDEYDD